MRGLLGHLVHALTAQVCSVSVLHSEMSSPPHHFKPSPWKGTNRSPIPKFWQHQGGMSTACKGHCWRAKSLCGAVERKSPSPRRVLSMVGFGGASLTHLHPVSIAHQHWEGNWSQRGAASLNKAALKGIVSRTAFSPQSGKKSLINIFLWTQTLHLRSSTWGFYLLTPYKCCFSLFPRANVVPSSLDAPAPSFVLQKAEDSWGVVDWFVGFF